MEIEEVAFEKFSPVPLLGKNNIKSYITLQKKTQMNVHRGKRKI